VSAGLRSLATLLLAVLAAGCGYTFGSPAAPGVARTFALDVATNESFWQRREIELTRSLDRELTTRLGWRRAPASAADALLRVRIERIDSRTLVTGTSEPLREGALRYAVHAELVAPQSGNVLMRRTYVDLAEYRPALGEDQSTAEQEASYDLARKIVEDVADEAAR
jgi:hypothetical protein